MSEWQPIETAPRDGTRVIVFVPVLDDGDVLGKSLVFEACYRPWGWGCEPTHWMPLPDPPQ